MKPTSHLLCIAAASLLLSACGQRGPLYLPTAPAPATPAHSQAVAPPPAASAATQSSAPATK